MNGYNPFTLEGKTVLITGASSGIGKTTALECSRMSAKLIISGRNQIRLQDTFNQLNGDGHQMIKADLNEEEDIKNLVEQLPKEINGIVLCAGISMTIPLQFCSREKLQNTFDTNFFAQVELIRLLLKKKKLKKGTSIVFVSSIGGVTTFNPGTASYGASKAAINSFMKFCAKELANRKIRANSVNPGVVHTPLADNGAFSQEQRDKDLLNYPLGRYGETEDIAHAIIYLLSDAASWVTGQSLIIDGGYSI